MRDERWVHRFLYAWNDTLFFDPLDVYYEPRPDHFLATLDERHRARFVRSGIWWSHRHNPDLPAQGWKIHVSASRHNVREVAASVVAYLTGKQIDFKIALDLNIFEMLNSKGMTRGSGGKLVTVYPRDDDEFRSCLADLARLLDGSEGAYVLSDLRYRDSKSLYFRYGQFLATHTLDILGRRLPRIAGPDGEVADDRRPGFAQPSWQPWPFTDWKPEEDGDDEDLLGGRFRVTGAIQFSNSGGVYTAEDTARGDRKVILKEARPHTNPNPRQDHDAVDILAREWTFLNRLADAGCFPAPIVTFSHWEHHFIAEEYVEGTDIRSVLLERNPLARPVITAEGSREFLRIFLAVFRGLARAVLAAHERNVILGDLSASNLLVDPDTFEVTVIDLESCRLAGPEGADGHLEKPVELYTPGFSHSRSHSGAPVPEDDLHALANTMAYFIFPIAAMSFLRPEVLGLYRVFTDGLGWPARIHELLVDLSHARVTLAEVLELLEHEESALVGEVRPAPPRPVVESTLGLAEVGAGVAAFVEAAADTDRATLFPVDPFAHVTNPLSLGFGASGVLWALNASGIPVRPAWRHWLQDGLADIDVAQYPDGLMNGLAGIAWAADSLGLRNHARELLAHANRRAPEIGDHTFYYGLAGLGMTNLHFYLRSHAERDLAAARECARALCDSAKQDGRHVYWLNEFSADGPLTGLGFGQAGTALFLLRMFQVTGDERCLRLGRGALAWEMDHAEPLGDDDGLVMFNFGGTMEPYVEVGSAGVAQVLLRYGELDDARTVLRAVDVAQSVLPGYGFGMSGIADAMLDAAAITGDTSYRDTALRQLDFVRKVFLFEPDERFGIPRRDGVAPLGVPGEGLLRCSTDYLTGSAGVLRVLHRVNHGGTADFLLDEVSR
ncbi:class III lanthionine synthetase LanKC [Kitasatospora sp. RG8]|uniref:class III lanthionine synthetase LanKC n=1 Tax=Kitasatospora sp. RG8 TaxID=2820815 RepID=UPI001ADEE321|nr:class III lanthionine synthetase LanKC [Kitasatospora sp. RG8]MBP0449122.1 class III lanthionine synthetase LanKC [Kitasatospora sp. RG8]